MKRNLFITLIILAVIGIGASLVFAQPLFGPGMMEMGPGMMESVNSEYKFLVKMIPHHEEAVTKAKILRDNTDREEIKEFAKEIIKVQTEEIKSRLESYRKYLKQYNIKNAPV